MLSAQEIKEKYRGYKEINAQGEQIKTTLPSDTEVQIIILSKIHWWLKFFGAITLISITGTLFYVLYVLTNVPKY